MSIEDCINRVSAAMSGGRLRKNDIKSIVEELDAEAKKVMGQDNPYADVIKDLGERFDRFYKRQIAEEKRRALLQLRSRQQFKTKYNDLVEQGLSPKDALIASMVGLNIDGISGSRNSIAAKQNSFSNGYTNRFVKHLQSEDLLQIWKSKDHNVQLQIMEAMRKLNTKGEEKPTGKIGRIAEIWNTHIKTARERLRRAGVDTRDLEGFTISQSHEIALMISAGEVEWKNFIREKLDYNEIFKTKNFTPEDIEDFLTRSYRALITGVRQKARASLDEDVVKMAKPRNFAEKLASSRVIHFKSTKDFFEYNQKFGKGSIQESMLHSLRGVGFDTALLEGFGPNPRANFDRILSDIKNDLRSQNKIDEIQAIEDTGLGASLSGKNIEALFNNIDGTAFIAENPKGARIWQNVRGVVTMAKLGGATISALSDIPIAAETLSNNGINFVSSYVKSFASSVKRISPEERIAFADMIDTYQEHTVGSIANRMGLFDEQPGKMQEALRLFFKANLLEWWTNAHKEGVAAALSSNLASVKNLEWENISNKLGAELDKFGITKSEWDMYRGTDNIELNNKQYMTAENVDMIPDEVIAKHLGETDLNSSKIKQFRQDLRDKFESYFIETVQQAVVTPGAREMSVQNFGFQPGTKFGEFMRNVMLFKSFPISFGIKVLGPAYRKAKNGDMASMAHLILGMSAFGAVALAAKDVVKGRDPSSRLRAAQNGDVTPFKYFSSVMLQGGGLGIYGDFLFGKYNRFGGGLSETLAGPVLGGMVNDIGRLYSNVTDVAAGEKEIESIGANILDVAKNYTPGSNLFYVAPALNYFLIYNLQEAMNPGYLSRMEQRMKRDYGIEFLTEPVDLRPSSVVQ